ncbi:MAG: hypothetical protein FWC89_13480 [Defluviitaleaceae bacterium]|nr:hypothetical protein [Defluviitaleaceae bacterium]
MDFRRRIIDVFINSTYLYDQKVVIYYNLKDGKQISYVEMLESTDELEESENGETTANAHGSTSDNSFAVFGFQRDTCA